VVERGATPFSALRRFARSAAAVAAEDQEFCDFCSEPIPARHRHLLEVANREITCVCRACSILFDKDGASGGKYRLVPDRRLYLDDFELTDAQWENLHIPVGMAFFFHSTPAGRVVAYYPSPMGPTESLLRLTAWDDLAERNPLLRELKPDVEALLVNRARGARQHFLVPLDECYRLVGLIRVRWRGLSGGQEVWAEIGRFFEELRGRSKVIGRDVATVARPAAGMQKGED
jgi:hypothetical protein